MTQDNGNGRVTMAVLGEQMKQAQATLDKMDSRLERIETSQAQAASRCDKCETRQDDRWQAHAEVHRDLNAKKWAGDVAGWVLGVLGIVFNSPIKIP